MNIGIIVYSETGNTLKVCESIKSGMEATGQNVAIERVETSGSSRRDMTTLELANAPDPLKYDALIFASPVQAFSLAQPMQKYMSELKQLNGKKAAFVMTKGLPFRWTGATHALSQMNRLAGDAGAVVVDAGTVIWPARNADQDTDTAVEKLKQTFA